MKKEKFRKPELTYKEYKEPLKSEIFQDTTTTEKTGVVVVETNGHKSKFSIEECLRYTEMCERDGQEVKNRYGLASYLFESGERDALISAKLYPEQPEPAAVSVPAENTLSGEILEALEILTDMLDGGEDISDMRQWYRAELWDDLMKELEKR